jgi:putative transposase
LLEQKNATLLNNEKRFHALLSPGHVQPENLAICVDKSIKGEQVCEDLEKIKAARGLPQRIKVDNDSAFFFMALDALACLNKVNLDYFRPGTPAKNLHFESINCRFRNECLNMNWFISFKDARDKFERRRKEDNEFRPHSAAVYLTPTKFAWKTSHEVDRTSLSDSS